MIELLRRDSQRRPDLFRFFGAIPAPDLEKWLQERQLSIPNDLKAVWQETGGGELFESETILGPFGPVGLADDVNSVNRFHQEKGMSKNYLIFHVGLGGVTAVDAVKGEYVSLREDSYVAHQRFRSLSDWYEYLIRREYAARYGLDAR